MRIIAGGDSTIMATEARITINGTSLTDQESMTIRLAVDALAEIIGEQMGMKEAGFPLADAYLKAIGRVQELISAAPVSSPPSLN
jgi:hypothetical protein